MATRYPGALDRDPDEIPDNIADSDTLDSPNHATIHNNVNGAVLQIEEKLGIGDTVASAGAVLHGTAAGTSEWTSDPSVVGSLSVAKDSADAVINLTAHHDTEATAAEFVLRKSEGSAASPSGPVDDDAVLGKIMFQGYDGNSYANGAQIRAQVDGTPADGDMPTEMIFMVTPDGGSETPATALTLSPDKKATFAGEVHVDGSLIRTTQDGANAAVEIMSHSDTETVTPELRFYKSDNTNASPALVDDDAILGRVEFKGYDGDSYADGASIIARIDGTPSGSSMPTELDFRTTPVGSQTPASNMIIKPDGKVGIGDSTPLHTLEIHSDDDLTSFTGTNKGAVKICNSDYTSGDITALDFGYSSSNNPIGRIGLEITGSGSTLTFGTSNSYASGITNDPLRITPEGYVAIGGVTNPGTDGVLLVRHGSSNAGINIDLSSASSSVALVKGYSNVGGTDTLQFVIRSDGDFESRTNSYGAISDERAKTNIVDANSHTEDLKKLRVVNYQFSHQWDEEEEEFVELEELGEKHIGLIAQEVEKHFPKLIKNNNGPLSVKYSLLVPMLLQTVQELLDRVETLEG